jgi:hypothetical protein
MTTSEPLLPLDLPQMESASILFATPTANERPNRDLGKRIADKRQISLSEQVRMGMYIDVHQCTLMSSAAASPARTSQRLAREQASRASALVSGPRCAELLARYDPATQSWRTSQRCFLEGWTVFSETWPRSGMTRNGVAYELATWGRPTAATASGLWPTPNVPNGGRTIHHAEFKGNTAYHNGKKVQVGLEAMVKMWPTPGGSRPHDTDQISGRLANEIGGSLNPTWVEWLMGFPEGWTDLGASATPSSRRYRS